MSYAAPCRPRILAERSLVRVDLCGCGQVHVSIGPLTVRLGRAQYQTLCSTLFAAMEQLPADDGVALQ